MALNPTKIGYPITDQEIKKGKAAKLIKQYVYLDTRNVEDMSGMFSGAEKFNQPVNFDTSSVTNMTWIFDGATSMYVGHIYKFVASVVKNGKAWALHSEDWTFTAYPDFNDYNERMQTIEFDNNECIGLALEGFIVVV